jgi:hypothetical protein
MADHCRSQLPKKLENYEITDYFHTDTWPWTCELGIRHPQEAASVGEVGVLRISFIKTLQIVQTLWQLLEVTSDMLTPAQVCLVVRRTLRRIADMAIAKRRQRSCQRALRQPVSSWPRLRKNTDRKGSIKYSVGAIYA